MAKLYFKYGAMGSSKSAQALMTKFNYEEKDRKVWLIKPSIDTRDGADIIRSRIGLQRSAQIITPEQNVADEYHAAGKYDVIIADEPTSALDVSVRAQILNLLTDLKKELGLAMVFISHDIQTVRYISDDIIVMNGGKIVEQGEAKQVFQHPQDPYTKMLLGAAPSLLHPKLGE